MRELLRNGSFVRLFCGRSVTNAGDSLYYVAAMWLVYQLTGSSAYTGVAGFLTMAPSAIQFVFGPLVDRLPLQRVLVGTQLAQGVLVLVVPIAAAFDALSVWVILTVIPLLSLLNQPVYPAQSAALPRIVEREQLVGANSLFSLSYQGVDAAFNAVGGLLIASLGAVALFLVDSLTFGVATLLFATLRIPAVGAGDEPSTADAEEPAPESATDPGVSNPDIHEPSDPAADGGHPADTPADDTTTDDAPSSYLAELHDGIAFVRGTVVAKLLAGAVVVNFSVGGVMAVLPAYADVLAGARAYGLLTAVLGVGLLGGALVGGAVAGVTSATLVLWAAGASFALLAAYVFVVPNLRRMPRVSDVSSLAAT